MLHVIRSSVYRYMSEQLDRLAVGDFTPGSRERHAADHKLARAVRRTAGSLVALIRLVDRSSKELHRKMNKMSAQSETVTEQVHAVTATIREMAAGMQDAAGHVHAIAEEVGRIGGVLQDAKSGNTVLVESADRFAHEVRVGQTDMTAAAGNMMLMTQESAVTRAKMEQLESALRQIAGMVRLIGEISDQTQLLALNANIEAAHAGEYGRGFAIVAREISRLAEQTRREAEGIQQAIQHMDESAGELSGSISRMQATVERGADAMQAAADQSDTISDYLAEVLDRIRTVDRQLEGITASTMVVTDAAVQTSAMIQQAAAGSEEVLASAELQLSSIQDVHEHLTDAAMNSLTLRSAVSQFRLPAEDHSHPLREELDAWVSEAMGIRAIMVSMVECRDPEEIREWNRKKAIQESRLSDRFNALTAKVRSGQDERRLLAVKAAWEAFSEAKDRNAQWMLDGQYAEAQEGLTTVGRQRFKAAMDAIREWMEARE